MSTMKIRVDRAALADAAAWVALVAPRTSHTPVLGGLKLTADSDRLAIRAFNYETSHEAAVAADVIAPGEALVSAKFFTEIVSQAKGDTIELVLDGQSLTIGSGRSTYRLRTMSVLDYPTLPDFPTPVGSINKGALADAVNAVDFAVLRDKTIATGDLATLGGIHIVGTSRGLDLIASDRHSIGATSTNWAHETDVDITVPNGVIPTALKGMTGTIQLGVEGGTFGLTDDTRTVVTRLIEGDFPDVARFLTMPSTTNVEISPSELAAAVKRAIVFGDAASRVVLTFEPDEVTVASDNEDGDAAEYVECVLDGDPIAVLFNGDKLAAALAATASETVRLQFTEPGRPVGIHPTDASPTAAVVMPRRKM